MQCVILPALNNHDAAVQWWQLTLTGFSVSLSLSLCSLPLTPLSWADRSFILLLKCKVQLFALLAAEKESKRLWGGHIMIIAMQHKVLEQLASN